MEHPEALTAPRPATPLVRLLGPMQEFMHHAAASGIVLLVATVAALILANTPFATSYDHLLHTPVGFMLGPWQIQATLQHWINDGLMAIFFFVVGLEIKREFQVGELASLRAALLPVLAAVGGAAVPALIFLSLNAGRLTQHAWGVPMATDIAFALGVLALLGSRVPLGLKVFVTAVAIIDDVLAVIVIAVFYSSGLNLAALAIASGLLVVLLLINRGGVQHPVVYSVLGVGVWLAFLQSGLHATLAGVLVAWTIPAHNRLDPAAFVERGRWLLDRFAQTSLAPTRLLTDEEQQTTVRALEDACEAVQAPLQRLEHGLHGWVAFAIMPIFALANAGVALSLSSLNRASWPLLLGVSIGLIVGKPIGLLGTAWLAVRFKLATLPQGVHWRHMIGAGCLAGIGFTMSLFIANLALSDPALLGAAKLGILVASLCAGLLGYAVLRAVGRNES